jgi:hypothetical protein
MRRSDEVVQEESVPLPSRISTSKPQKRDGSIGSNLSEADRF